jgi:hypothetical protein
VYSKATAPSPATSIPGSDRPRRLRPVLRDTLRTPMLDAKTSSIAARPASDRGRVFVEAVLVVVTLALAMVLFFHRGKPLTEGARTEATFFLSAADSRTAECAADLEFEDYRCRYNARERKYPRSDKREVVVPLNGDRGLMLLHGVFEPREVSAQGQPPARVHP